MAAAALVSCGASEVPFGGLPRLSVDAEFAIQNLCDIGVSPQIRLANVPHDTAKYLVQITNTYVLIQTPWREVIPASSMSEIPEGAAKTYVAPCIGDNLRFPPLARDGYLYRVEVLAEDATDRPLAYGVTTSYVQSPYLAARRLRQLQQQGQGNTTATQPAPSPPPADFPPGPTPDSGILGSTPNTGLSRY